MIEISHHMTFLDLYLDDLLLWSSLEKDITNKELLRSAHGWVSFLFLFLDRLSRVFLLHRCTAYYVCQYNKVFAKSIGPSPMQLMSPLKLEKTRSLIISRTFQFAAFAIDVHLDQDIYGYGLMLLPCQLIQSSFFRKIKSQRWCLQTWISFFSFFT